MVSAHGTVTIRPKEVIPIYREKWDAVVADYKYDLVNRDFVSRNGNIYQVKVLRPGQFVPVGIDPDSEAGENYWEIFNKLVPSVTNFLIVVDEDGMPQTLLSGGRIQTKFLNIGSLNMSETRLWGGAEPMIGEGLALVNDPGDRKFVVYNDATHYVEMFQRENEWGFKGVDGNTNSPVFSLGKKKNLAGNWVSDNKIGSFIIEDNWLRGTRLAMSGAMLSYDYDGNKVFIAAHPDMTGGGADKLGTFFLSGASYAGLSSRMRVALIAAAPVDNDSCAIALTSGRALFKGQIHFDNVKTGTSTVNVNGSNGHFVHLSPTSGNPTVNIASGLPVGSWFIIAQSTSAGGYYYMKLNGSEKFKRRNSEYSQINSHNQDPSLIFKVNTTTWLIGNLPVNWIDWK